MRLLKSMIAALCALAGAGTLHAETAPAQTKFTCAKGISFAVEYGNGGQIATVRTAHGDFLLNRKISSLGDRYTSSKATLIVDGDFAAFVTEAADDFIQCKAAPAHASSTR
jgi:membrane-bound inhibitor of C-type lysozyme